MLIARSPPSRVTNSPHGESRDNPVSLKNFLRTLATDTTRLTYRQSRHAKLQSLPVKGTEASKHEVRGSFLPLLPLPDPDPNRQQDTRGDCPPVSSEPNETVGLQVSRPPARLRSRSPKVLKVYSNVKRSRPLRIARTLEGQGISWDGNDHDLDEARPVSCENLDKLVTKRPARKRKKGAEPDLAEVGGLATKQSLPRKRKRPRRLQVSGLALARTIPSPIVSEDDTEVRSVSLFCERSRKSGALRKSIAHPGS